MRLWRKQDLKRNTPVINGDNKDLPPSGTSDKKEVKGSTSSSSNSSASFDSTKRKRVSKEVEVGMRVKSKFDCGDWYEGRVTNVRRKKGGGVYNISIPYDDGDEEECDWPMLLAG